MTIRTFLDLDALAHAAADELSRIARDAIAARGVCHVALSGGSTPKHLFDVLAGRGKDALPWHAIHLWWGDERTVPPDHPDSNYGMAREHLIAPLALASERIHRMVGEGDPAIAARAYERELLQVVGMPPVLDLVWLGMGPDGHTASLFPGSPGLAETEHVAHGDQITRGVPGWLGIPRDDRREAVPNPRYAIANPVDSPLAHGKTTRLTLTFPAINAARFVHFLVAGADKADRVRDVLEGPRGRYPAQLVEPHGGELLWLLDRAAAAQLGGKR
jgi:6-phosphogluconolactonase